MDYFFAQVEERENPRFKGKPLVVGSDPKGGSGRGVVSTCNYEAREFGIHSGMAISKAYRKCPKATFLPVNMSLYSQVSESIFKTMEAVSPKCERVSLDEAYLDLSKIVDSYSKAKRIGEDLKKIILRKEGLTCSVGIGENKMIAKIASEEDKPGGLTVVKPKDTFKFIKNKSIENIPGIGPKTKEKVESFLGKSNLKIIDLSGVSKEELVDFLGKRGADIYHKARGEDNSKINPSVRTKSIGKEITFEENTSDPEKILSTFKEISEQVFQSAKAEEEKIKTVVVVCRFEGFETYTRQTSFEPIFPDKKLIYKKAINLMLKLLTEKAKPVRLLGIRVVFSSEDEE